MLFEVIRDGAVMMHTNDEKCIPTPELLREMADAKYGFRKNGKSFKPPAKRNKKKKEE